MVDTLEVTLGPVVLTVAAQAGPRILGHARSGRVSPFADLPDATLGDPVAGTYHLLGGHRLWRAPEVPAVTYQPDDHGVRVDMTGDAVELVGPADRDGVVKRLVVRQRGDVTVVDHTLHNQGPDPVRTAAWAITQLAPGGTAILPVPAGDPSGRLPDRHLVLWPYTDLGDPEVRFAGDTIRVEGSSRPAAFKVGFANRRGWLAYHHGEQLFVKWGPLHDEEDDHVDLGSTAECYRDDRFLELETVGPLTTIQPGETLHHREGWTVLDVEEGALERVLATLPVRPREMTA